MRENSAESVDGPEELPDGLKSFTSASKNNERLVRRTTSSALLKWDM
jgi:hypothetical protein